VTSIAAVIVHYHEEPAQLRAAIDSLLAQTRPPSEVLVLDNERSGALAATLVGYGPHVRAIDCGANLGYVAINLAAARTSAEYLVCLNPDARASEDCLERLAAVADADPTIAIVGAQILLEDGATRNAGANPLHPTGISPAGGYGEPREDGEPREAIVVSGACLLARVDAFRRIGGFYEDLFLYYEDVDLCWRTWIAGDRVLYCPRATVRHGYDFGGRPQKWFLLERNRLSALLCNYERHTLALLAPLLLATELGLLGVAALGGWLPQKLRAYGSLWARRRRLAAHRRQVQSARRRGDVELLRLFDDRLHSPLLPRAGAAIANLVGVPYMRAVRRLAG
jgi:GT2 family glycosyltransferase